MAWFYDFLKISSEIIISLAWNFNGFGTLYIYTNKKILALNDIAFKSYINL